MLSPKTLIRGGQVFLHNLRMLKQVALKLFVAGWLMLSMLGLVAYLYIATPTYQRDQLVSYYKASVQTALWNQSAPITVQNAAGQKFTVKTNTILHDPNIQTAKAQFMVRLWQGLLWSLFWGFLLSSGLLGLVLQRYGKRQTRTQHVRGRRLVASRQLKKSLLRADKASSLTLADVPLVKRSEWGHFLVHGTTGAGKSTAIVDLLRQVRNRGERAIVYCKSGDYVREFYRPGQDILLNPFDQRSAHWDLWQECQAPYEFDDVAKAMVPLPPGTDPFWAHSARAVFSAAAWQLHNEKDRSLKGLLSQLLSADISEAAHLLRGTEAASLVSEKIEKTAVSIKAVLATYLKGLRYVNEEGERFSIRQFIQKEDNDCWLFVTSNGRQHEALKPLITLWLNLAGTALLDLTPNYQRRIWIALDELPSLQQLPFLLAQLAEVRKFGGCMVLGVQNIAHLRSVYGSHAAQAIADLCNTRVFLRSNDADVAQWASQQLGSKEVEDMREAISYGANTMRDGVSLQRQRSTRLLVTPTEIQQLNEREGVLMLPGEWPLTKLFFPIVKSENKTPGFVPAATSPVTDLDNNLARYGKAYVLLHQDGTGKTAASVRTKQASVVDKNLAKKSVGTARSVLIDEVML